MGMHQLVKDKEEKGRTENHAHISNLGAEKMLLALISKGSRAVGSRFQWKDNHYTVGECELEVQGDLQYLVHTEFEPGVRGHNHQHWL